jgi:hypothetical protein
MGMRMKILLKSRYEVLRSVRGAAVPAGRTIASKVDKMRDNARREFRQNRRMFDNV